MGSFRQKMIGMVGENGVWEALEGFLSARGGFVRFFLDLAGRSRVVRVLRNRKREDLKT